MILIYLAFALLLLPCLRIKTRTIASSAQLLQRQDTISIRGISAIFVIVAHYSSWISVLEGVHFFKPLLWGLGQLGGIGVLLFFFVSGYGINESYGNKKTLDKYIFKRFSGVYFPYVIIKIVTVTAEVICGVSNSELSIPLRYLQILLIPDWFILVVVLQYISYYICHRFIRSHLLIASIVIDSVISLVFILTDKPLGWFNALWLFTFGIWISEYQERVKALINRKYWLMTIVSFVGFLFMGVLFAKYKDDGLINIAKPISGVFICLLFCCLLRRLLFGNIIIDWLGRKSLFIYIVHISVWNCMLLVIDNPTALVWTAIIFTILISQGLSILVDIVNKRLITHL